MRTRYRVCTEPHPGPPRKDDDGRYDLEPLRGLVVRCGLELDRCHESRRGRRRALQLGHKLQLARRELAVFLGGEEEADS